MGEYGKFINKYFPFSASMENEEALYRLICESNLISQIMLKYISLEVEYLTEFKLIFYKRFRDGVNKLLMYLPLNEEIGIYACMRYSIEHFLKFVYAIYFDEELEVIGRTGYRHIKEDIKQNTVIADDIKNKLQRIYSYYAKYSNDVHAKEIDENEELVSLGRIIRAQNEYSKEIENDLRNFLNISYKIMNSIFHIRYEMLNASERINIEKLRPKRKEIVLKILEYES
jgi:hypothetical protein